MSEEIETMSETTIRHAVNLLLDLLTPEERIIYYRNRNKRGRFKK